MAVHLTRDGIPGGEERLPWRWAEGRGHKGTPRPCLWFSCQFHGAFPTLVQGVCGLPRLGRATRATATDFLKVYIAVAFWGLGWRLPEAYPLAHPLMTLLSLLY